MSLTTGTQLGPYEIVCLLGTGGMGEVWKARDTRLNRTVAVKRLTGRHSERFDQEARAIAANLLRQGASIQDAVHLAGYCDQAHLTRSLRHLVGETPARISRQENQLSFLYKTTPP